MSWEEFLRLPDHPRNEWVDGEVLVMAPVAPSHGSAAGRLIRLLGSRLPELDVGPEVGVWLPRNRLRAPDVVVWEGPNDEPWLTEPPVLVVEVLSPSTRSEDTVRKSTEYAEGGVGQYWIVDPEHSEIDVYANRDGAWDLLLHLDESSPEGEVVVGEHGTVPIDLREVLS